MGGDECPGLKKNRDRVLCDIPKKGKERVLSQGIK